MRALYLLEILRSQVHSHFCAVQLVASWPLRISARSPFRDATWQKFWKFSSWLNTQYKMTVELHLWEHLPSHPFCDATCQKFSKGSSVLNALHKIMELTFEKFHQVAHFVARHAAILCMSNMNQLKRATWLIYATWRNYACVWHDAFIPIHVWHDSVTWCHTSYSYDSFLCVTWLIHMWDMTRFICDWVVCGTWLIHTCDMTQLHNVTHTTHMTHSYAWHDSFICATWLIHMCDRTHSFVWHDSFICVTWLNFWENDYTELTIENFGNTFFF
jgi:hypothetical protein